LQEVSDDVVYILHRYFPDAGKLPAMAISKPIRLAQQAEILQLFPMKNISSPFQPEK
jgi:hypothetical protein